MHKSGDELTFNNETKTIKEWGSSTGIGVKNIIMRLRRGKSVEEALTLPLKTLEDYKTVGDKQIKIKRSDIEKRLTDQELGVFMAIFTVKNFGKLASRNKGICGFFLNTGLRLNELCSLRIYDLLEIDGNYKQILDVRAEITKRNVNRQIPLNSESKAYLDLLIDKKNMDFNSKLINISSRQVRTIINQAAIRCGLNRLMNPHGLRHTFLSKIYSNTKDIAITQKLAGHKNASTTINEYVHPLMEDLEKAVKNLNKGEENENTKTDPSPET